MNLEGAGGDQSSMRVFTGAVSILSATMAAALAIPSATAASPEEAYVAARDGAVAGIKAAADAENRGSMDYYGASILALEEQERAGLEQQMRAIIGRVTIKGSSRKGCAQSRHADRR